MRLIRLERRGAIAVLTLDRPDRANALNDPLREQLRGAAAEVASDGDVGALVVTGAGRHFCAGADLRERRTGRVPPGAFDGFGLGAVPQPVIAAVNGAALGGGCEIALACDFRIMAEDARIGLPEVTFGALPRGGGTARLPRLVGPARAKYMIMTGEPVTACEAVRIGLADAVAPAGEALAHAIDLAGRLCRNAAYAVRTAKTLLDRGADVELDAALALERELTSGMATRAQHAAARADAAARNGTYSKIFSHRDEGTR